MIPKSMKVLFVAVALLVGFGSGSAQAAPQGPWVLPAGNLSATGQNAQAPQVAVAADGTATVVWYRFDGSDNIIQAATRPPGGAFGTPVDLSEAGEGAHAPQIAVAPDGTVTAVWVRSDGSKDIVQAATRPPGGAFGAPVNISAGGQYAQAPQVAVAADGTATVIWVRSNGANDIVQAATRPPGGAFGAPVDLSAAGQSAYIPQVAFAPDGTATAIWVRSNGTNNIIQAATRPPGGAFGAPVDLSATDQAAYGPHLAVAPDGTTTVVWDGTDGSNTIAQAATRAPGGAFGTPVDLSVAGQSASSPQIAVAPDGTVTAVWVRSDGTNLIAQAATRPPGGIFGAPVDLSAAGQSAQDPRPAAAPDGTVTVVWIRFNGTNNVTQAATRPSGGVFGTPIDLSAAGQNAYSAQVAIALDGTATAVWMRSSDTNVFVQSASTLQPAPLLQVSRTGNGAGTVSSSPAGISCGGDCAETFPSFTKVTLTATPKPGSVFAGWSGGCSGKATCQITVLDATQVNAKFEKARANLGALKITPKAKKLRAGKTQTIKVAVKSIGNVSAKKAKVCVKAPKKLVKVKRCAKLGGLAAGATRIATFKAKLTRKAKVGRKVKLTFTATAQGVAKRTAVAKLTRRR
ncbi:MAG: hypothetical protein J0H98_04210 [Solirubrobacterales bacterium]|nr:hypothetical protein [Solirubrobacterales bacterium]